MKVDIALEMNRPSSPLTRRDEHPASARLGALGDGIGNGDRAIKPTAGNGAMIPNIDNP
jgi:hypothetical protein